MTLDEAIEHAEQKATDINCSCQQEHAQLAVWLKELRTRRELNGINNHNNLLKERGLLIHDIRINGQIQSLNCELGSGFLDKDGHEIFEGDRVLYVNRALNKRVIDTIYFANGAFWLGKGTLPEYDSINLEIVGHATNNAGGSV